MSSLRCYRCAEVNNLDDAFWRDALERDTSSGIMTIRAKPQRSGCEVETAWSAVCPQCEATFDLAPLAADPATTATACTAGHSIRVWPADPIALGVFPNARFVVAEPGTITPLSGSRVDVLACAGCGAPLAMQESSRVIVCDHCNATNVVADAMSPKSRMFCIVVEDGRPARTEADRHWDLAMTTSNPEKLRALASDPSPKVRKAVADGRLTPTDVLVALTNDPDPVVRKAAAMNPSSKRKK